MLPATIRRQSMKTSTSNAGDEPEAALATARSRADLQRDTADYIAELTEELVRSARTANLELLAYMLDIARAEARTSVHRLSTERGGG